jgi:hypothetical protein
VNCAYNESSVFSQPSINGLLARYQLVRLYTDKVRAGFDQKMTPAEVRAFQQKHFKTAQLPLYVILRPKGGDAFEIVGAPYGEGKINDVDGFARYLREPPPDRVAAQSP